MARLPESQITRLKTEISLVRLAEQQGYAPKKQGKDYAVRCPFHDDLTPSLIISPKSNLFNCFGCGAAGSVIDWVMKTQRLNFREAATWLSNECLPFASESPVSQAKEVNNESLSLAASADDQQLLQRVIAFYHQTLKHSSEAQAYLAARGLDDLELIEHFKLGHANRTLGLKLPEKNRKAGAEIRGQLQRIGLYRESGHEHFNGSLVIPVMDEAGNIREVYGRKLLDNLRKGTPKHLYLPGAHAGVFNAAAFLAPEIILCESLIDALTFWRWGFRHVTTSYGTGGFTEALKQAFKNSQVQRVLIAYDRDEAGDKAAAQLAEQLMLFGIDCYRVLFPKGMDANSYARQVTPAPKSLDLVIRKAQWMGKGAAPERQAQAESETQTEIVVAEALPETDSLPSLPVSKSSPVPTHTPPDIEAIVDDKEVTLQLGGRHYRVRGLHKALSYEVLKINLLLSNDAGLHVDSLDLYQAKQRHSFIKQAALELGLEEQIIKKDLGQLLLKLESLQQQHMETKNAEALPAAVQLSDEDQREAMALLKDEHLLSRVLKDFKRAGVVGEETNKLVGYLAAVSRRLDNPLAIIIQSTSAAGKSSLMNAVLAMMPQEECVQYSAMTGQSLFYMGEISLKHKILALAEEEGAEQASYALKLLQSEGELTIASTGKDAEGNLTTQEYRVEGPIMLFSTTTAIDIDEELMNRCIVLTVNESREQTRLIHQLQRERDTLSGLLAKEDRDDVLRLHQNAQRLLASVRVVNPYATQLTFMDNQTRSRRDHMKYLQLIKTITLLHQHQRETKTVEHQGKVLSYIEVNKKDIEMANHLAHEVLGRSLDELPPQTRLLLDKISDYVREACEADGVSQSDYRFSRRALREAIGWGNTQLKVHLDRLEELEYVLTHGYQGRGKQIAYELAYQGEGDKQTRFLMGLIDPDALADGSMYDAKKSGEGEQKTGPKRPQVGAISGVSRGDKKEENPSNTVPKSTRPSVEAKLHNTVGAQAESYRSRTPATA